MKSFAYLNAKNLEAAAAALQAPKTVAKGAGTDLLDLLKERVVEPDAVVNLLPTSPPALGGGVVHALHTLDDVARSEWVRANFPAVHIAAAEAATPQVRNVGTVGGNLCQHSRCWYFRNKSFDCWRRGGFGCPALVEGAENRYHAIFPREKCASAHTSNLAPALIAVGAKVACVHPDGGRTMDLELLYDNAATGLSDTSLRPGELVEKVLLEPTALSKRSTYIELRERQSFDFAIASVAVALDMDGGMVKDVRIVCGAVAPTPYRAKAAEDAMRGKALDVEKAAEAVVKDAQPSGQNKFKVVILKRLVRRALEELK